MKINAIETAIVCNQPFFELKKVFFFDISEQK